VKSWMPTRLNNGEGRVDREATDGHLIRSTGVMSTAWEEGGLGNWGRPELMEVCASNVCLQGRRSDRETERAVVAWRPGNAGGAKGPHFGRAFEEAKVR